MAAHSQTLLLTARSDLVLSARHGTEGGHACLDYIPGSTLLGAAVGAWLRAGKPFDPAIFLSGALRFHNACPRDFRRSQSDQGTAPVPLAFHQPKEAAGKVFNGVLHSLNPKDNPDEPQLKQMRKDFIPLNADSSKPLNLVRVAHTSRMKTAIEAGQYGRSKEGNLFDYQAIQAGQSFLCTIEADAAVDASAFASVVDLLRGGGVRIGRSRSAEFGNVRVEAAPALDAPAQMEPEDDVVVLYLASDLILMRNGNPVVLPAAADFNLPDWLSLDLTRTFIRTRAYSPWIHYRDGYDIERQAIAQGSVLTFKARHNDDVPGCAENLRRRLASGWGLHRNEGCGRILVNPAFLLGSATFTLAEAEEGARTGEYRPSAKNSAPPPSTLTRLLQERHERKQLVLNLESIARNWAEDLAKMMKRVKNAVDETPGKTQWSIVRSIASSGDDPEKIHASLKEFFTTARRKKMWTEEVSCEGRDRNGRGHRLSLATFLLGAAPPNANTGSDPEKMVWREKWFQETTPFVRDDRRGRAWTLLVALTATHVIRSMNRAESEIMQKKLNHV